MPSHRKRVRHYVLPGHCNELTFSCYKRTPLLTNGAWREELARAVDQACLRHAWRLAAFVFMPEHVHLIVHPAESSARIAAFLFALKRPFSYRIKRRLQECGSPLLEKLTIRQRPGVTTFRFWQEGPGFDRNLTSGKAILAAIDYVHLNPVRRGLCGRAADWRWSSARWYESDGASVDPALPQLTPLPGGFFHTGAGGEVG